MLEPTAVALFCRLQHQRPTSDEVGMRKLEAGPMLFCRQQHQGPTSDEGVKKSKP